MKTLNLDEAAQFLKLHPEEVRRRAKAGIIPGAKLGKRWVFIEEDLAAYMRSLYALPRQALQVGYGEKQLCHSANVIRRGGLVSPSGERIRCSAATEDKTQAQEFHDKLKAESWRVVKLGDKPKRTWDEAAYKWLMETQHKASHKQDMKQVAWVQQFFRGRLLSELTREAIAEVGEVKRKETSPSTANRYLATIRAILRRAAFDWEWIEKAPFIRLYKEPKRRIRWIEPEQVKMLLDELPDHLVDLVKFSLCTGLRKRNVTELEWSQVDIQRNVAWIHADQAKARKSIHISLNATATEVLRKQIGKHPIRVFTYKGNPIIQVNTKAWYKALKRAGIENFRWHDLRHTWASWLTQKGVPLNVIQEMGAWESTEMVKRYAHLAPEQFRKHAMVVDEILNDTILTQVEN